MYAHGIEILDGADDDHVVGQVAHDLKLVFLPAEDRFFDQHFMHWGKIKAAGQDFQHLFAVIRNAAAAAAQRE